MRRFLLSGTANTRDLGGYPVPGGATVWGRTFRSDAPVSLTAEDVGRLRAAGITTHIDLRTLEEVERRPSALQNMPGFEYHHVDLCAAMQMLPETEAGVAESYLEMTRQTGPMARIFGLIAATRGPLLFHCTAGKDRTGVVAAILLMLAGVPREEIMADYILTAAYMREPIRKFLEADPDLPAYIIIPKVDFIEGFLDGFAAAYGDARGYLASIGVSAEEINSITQRLTVLT